MVGSGTPNPNFESWRLEPLCGLPPARLSPLDVLQHIFDAGTFWLSNLEDRMGFPLPVSQVNKTWRSFTHQSP